MPTYAQLSAEAAWRDETVTGEMDEFGDALCEALGVPRSHFGVKGDNSSGHMRGGHRSQAWILGSRYCTSRTYTVEPALPAVNLNDIPAFDITPKSNAQMLWICGNLDRVVRAGQLEEVVVWYGNLDNKGPVDGFDNIRNIIATSDRSHDWHLHAQLGRRFTRSRAVMQRILAALLGRPIPGGDDVGTWDDPITLAVPATEAALTDPPSKYAGTTVSAPAGALFSFAVLRIASMHERQQRIETALAVSAQREQAAAAALAASAQREQDMLAAIRALATAGGGSVDAAAIIARIDQRSADVTGTIGRLQAELDEHRDQLAAERARLAKALAGE